MRKLLILLLSIALFVLLVACTNQKEKASDQHVKQHTEAEKDVKIGRVNKNGMEINAVYMPHSVEVAPVEHGGKKGNIHLEADIHATDDNTFGFHEGEWIPYLTIKYKIHRLNTDKVVEEGQLYQMVAGDPHYASNVYIPESGDYELTYEISAPDIARHVEDVNGFYEPMTLKWKFKFKDSNNY
ncbi:iron transporter [Bacillus salipaludis]|uniref:iron transporter n=1 Tax=Bacillus salipaludis TaxID=2547811 RepID=UPI002E2120C2|nr:iron transporter [Bacillus salipaludis]